MNRFENGQSHRFISSNSALTSDPRRQRPGRPSSRLAVRVLRVHCPTCIESCAVQRSDIAATAAAYMGVGGMILSIFRMGMVLAKG